MEVSDDDEEIVELNEQQTNSKTAKNKEKNTSKSSLKKIKWNLTKYSIDSISQIVNSESSQSFYNSYSINEIDNEKKSEKNENNIKENKEIKNSDNTPLNIPETEFIYTFTWEEGGNEIKIIGSFTDWKESYDMKKDLNDNVYKISLPLHNKIYYYKFIVDGEWKYSEIQPKTKDNSGNINNILDLTNFIFNNTYTDKSQNNNKNEEEKKESSKKNIKKKKSSKLSGKKKN